MGFCWGVGWFGGFGRVKDVRKMLEVGDFFKKRAKRLYNSVKKSVKRGKNVTAFGRAELIITMFINLVMIVHRLVVTGKDREWRGVKMNRVCGL